ncbi:hypothetical protein [Pseudomonas sp. Irchel s3f7]|nr:hypothetical protein [Pseudomonas sp. Irchel s3f7]
MKINSTVKGEVRAKLIRLQKPSKYHSLFNVDGIDAFAKQEIPAP